MKARADSDVTTDRRTENSVVRVDGRRRLVREFSIGIGFAVVIAMLMAAIESTIVGRDLDLLGYLYVQRALRFVRVHIGTQPIQVAVLDISDLQYVPHEVYGARRPITPRDKLIELIDALTEFEPIAIGLDINFAPYGNDQLLAPSDERLFEKCLKLKRVGIPVFVGLNWSNPGEEKRRPETLIENKRYHELVAWVIVLEQTRRMPASFGDGPIEMPSLSWALAAQALGASHDAGQHHWFAELFSEERLHRGRMTLFAVDYSPLRELRQSQNFTARTIEPAAIRAMGNKTFRDRLVLVGNAAIASDTFTVPSEEAPVPGVYIHACAANTIATGPLYELTHSGRFAIDVAIVVLALIVVTSLRCFYFGSKSRRIAADRLFRCVTVVLLFGCCVFLVFYFRVLWSDFLLVGLFVVFHQRIEHWLVQLWRSTRNAASRTFKKAAFGGKSL